MPMRLAACDPCRSSKLSCDHVRPICSRCRERHQGSGCTYRERPFKRRKTPEARQVNSPRDDVSLTRVGTTSRNYPNPGYLGSSSYATIFGHLPTSNDNGSEHAAPDSDETYHPLLIDDVEIVHGAKSVEQFQASLAAPSCRALIEKWTTSGVNLALAEFFTKKCAETAEFVLGCSHEYATDLKIVSKNLFTHSCKPLAANDTSTFQEFCAQFSDTNARWETIGLFFTAAGRAAIDMMTFEPLYNTKRQQRSFQKLAMRFSDQCLDIALSLDCMNDLQLVLQYENFILHSFVDGDQSKSTSSCSALALLTV